MAGNLGTVTIEVLNRYLKQRTNKSLSLFHLNVQSARLKGDELTLLFESLDTIFDVVMLTETWYRDDDAFFVLPGYSHFVLNRGYGRGGGVSLQTSVSGFELLSDYSIVTPDYEALCIRKNRDIYSVLYRPPTGNVATFISFLENLFHSVNDERCQLFLGGDFNINMLEDSRLKDELIVLLTSNSFCNVILPPTRITSSSSTLIDLFVTNHDESNITAGVLSYGLSDHLPIFMFVNQDIPLKETIRPPLILQDISCETHNIFRENIINIDWSHVLRSNDLNECYDLFLNELKRAYCTAFPYKTIYVNKKSRKPWISEQLLKQIKKEFFCMIPFLKLETK